MASSSSSSNRPASLPAVLRFSETGLDYMNAMTRQHFLTGVASLDGLQRSVGKPGLRTGDLVELHGYEGSNRLPVLLQAVAIFALPRAYGGHESTILYFAMDGGLDVSLLRQLMVQLISSFEERQKQQVSHRPLSNSKKHGKTKTIAEVIDASLNRVIVLRCTDATDVNFALSYAEGMMAHPESHIRLLVFDNIASNFFEQRAATVAYLNTPGQKRRISKSTSWATSFGSQFAEKVDRLRRSHRILIIAFTPKYFDSGSSNSAHLLGIKWDSLRKHRIKV